MKNILIFLFTISLYSLEPSEKKYYVAFAQDDFSNEYHSEQLYRLKESLSLYPNIEFSYSDANSSISMQIMQIEEFIMQGVDIIIISAFDENITSKVIAQAYDYEVDIILINKEINNSKYTSYIPNNDNNITVMTNQMLDAVTEILFHKNEVKGVSK